MLALVRAAIGCDRRLPIIVAARGPEAITDFLHQIVGSIPAGDRNQKSEIRRQTSDVIRQMSDVRDQRSEIRM
jgi:hypothetical protein